MDNIKDKQSELSAALKDAEAHFNQAQQQLQSLQRYQRQILDTIISLRAQLQLLSELTTE